MHDQACANMRGKLLHTVVADCQMTPLSVHVSDSMRHACPLITNMWTTPCSVARFCKLVLLYSQIGVKEHVSIPLQPV